MPYLCSRIKDSTASLGGASAIGASSIALDLHEPCLENVLNVSMNKQLTERQRAMRQAAFDYLHFLTDQEMMVERIVDRRLTEMQPRIEQMVEERVASRLQEMQKGR